MKTTHALLLLASVLGIGTQASALRAQERTGTNRLAVGEFLIDPPTLINLGFEWFIQGDDNRNARSMCRIASRETPSGSRACRCCVFRASASCRAHQIDVISPNMFAGSILDLEPDTAYEARFVRPIPTAWSAKPRRP